jgi:hypothetical protein
LVLMTLEFAISLPSIPTVRISIPTFRVKPLPWVLRWPAATYFGHRTSCLCHSQHWRITVFVFCTILSRDKASRSRVISTGGAGSLPRFIEAPSASDHGQDGHAASDHGQDGHATSAA